MPPASVAPIGRLTTTSCPRAWSAQRAWASASRRPAPSGPSKAIRKPGYGRASATDHLTSAPTPTAGVLTLVEHREVPLQDRAGQRANLLALRLDRAVGVDHRHVVLVDHVVVFVDDPPLEQPVALLGILAQPQIEAGLVVLQSLAAGARQHAVHGDVERHAEVQREIRLQ